jgi:hypothetical protein
MEIPVLYTSPSFDIRKIILPLALLLLIFGVTGLLAGGIVE